MKIKGVFLTEKEVIDAIEIYLEEESDIEIDSKGNGNGLKFYQADEDLYCLEAK